MLAISSIYTYYISIIIKDIPAAASRPSIYSAPKITTPRNGSGRVGIFSTQPEPEPDLNLTCQVQVRSGFS